QDIALSYLDVLRLRCVLQIIEGDPVIDGQRVGALVSGDVEQHPTPDRLDDARRITLRGASRLRRRQVVIQRVLLVDMSEGVEMRAGMVVHEGEAGANLIALRVEVP